VVGLKRTPSGKKERSKTSPGREEEAKGETTQTMQSRPTQMDDHNTEGGKEEKRVGRDKIGRGGGRP